MKTTFPTRQLWLSWLTVCILCGPFQTFAGEILPAGKVIWWRTGDNWDSFSKGQTNGVLFGGNDIATNIVAVVADKGTALALDKTGTVYSYSGPNAYSKVATNVDSTAFGANNIRWTLPTGEGLNRWAADRNIECSLAGLSNAASILRVGNTSYLVLTKSGTLLGWRQPRDGWFAPSDYDDFNFIVVSNQILNNVTAVASISIGFYNCLALNNDGTVMVMSLMRHYYSPSSYHMAISTNIMEGLVPSTTTVSANAWRVNHSAPLGYAGQVVSNIAAVASAGQKIMVLRRNGTVSVFSGTADISGILEFVSTNVPDGLSNVVAIATSPTHNSVLKRDGTVVTWADGNNSPAKMPIGLSNVVAIAAGVGISWAITMGDLPPSVHVPPHGPLQEMAFNADLVFKGEVIESERSTNRHVAVLMYCSAAMLPDAFATKFKLISLIKGSCQTNEVILFHFKAVEERAIPPIAPLGRLPVYWSSGPPDRSFNFEKGQSYLIYAKKLLGSSHDTSKTSLPEEYIPLDGSGHSERDPRAFEPVTRTLDSRPLSQLSANEAHWQELNLLLKDHNPSNQLYALKRLSSMATTFGDIWEKSHDFKRENMLAAVQPLLHHTNDEIAIAALGCFSVRAECASLLDPYFAPLVEIASKAASPSRRAAAIAAFSGSKIPGATNSLDRWMHDPDPNVRAQAVRLLLDYPGTYAEQALTVLAEDTSASVRATVAEIIGKGKFTRNVATLATLFDDLNDTVHTNAGQSLLVFAPEDTADILKARLGDTSYYVQFIAKLSESDAKPWLAQLVRILEDRHICASDAPLPSKHPANGGNPGQNILLTGAYAKCWENLCRHLMCLPSNQLADGQMSRYTNLLEKMLPKNSTANRNAVHQLYELYKTKNLWLRSNKIRRQYKEEKGWFDQFDRTFSESKR